MDELLEDIRTEPKNSYADYASMGKGYSPVKISHENFSEMPEFAGTGHSMAFIDGGSAVIFESAGFSLGYIRVAKIEYAEKKSRSRREFFILVKNSDSQFTVRTSPKTEYDGLSFDKNSEDNSQTIVINSVMRLAELDAAACSKAEIIVIDGSLEAQHQYDLNRIMLLPKNVAAISKTCSISTVNGISLTKKLHDMKDGKWIYYPVTAYYPDMHPAKMMFAKFHKDSGHSFRIDMREKDFDILGAISKNCSDPIFLGYPYGLIEADSLARVSREEAETLRTRAMVKLGKGWDSVLKNLNSRNAHSILDKVSF